MKVIFGSCRLRNRLKLATRLLQEILFSLSFRLSITSIHLEFAIYQPRLLKVNCLLFSSRLKLPHWNNCFQFRLFSREMPYLNKKNRRNSRRRDVFRLRACRLPNCQSLSHLATTTLYNLPLSWGRRLRSLKWIASLSRSCFDCEGVLFARLQYQHQGLAFTSFRQSNYVGRYINSKISSKISNVLDKLQNRKPAVLGDIADVIYSERAQNQNRKELSIGLVLHKLCR